MPSSLPEESAGSAFVKGGGGCVLVFFAIGLLTLLAGGTVHLDGGGLVFLIVIGGGIGLLLRSIRGRARARALAEVGALDPWRCPACGNANGVEARACLGCGEARSRRA